MEQTANYGLNQWAAGDRIMREDFNADNAKVDQALGALAVTVAGCGNCRIWTTTYTGTGEYGSEHPCSITFPQLPVMALILTSGGFMFLHPNGNATYYYYASQYHRITVAWAENTVSWFSTDNASAQLNYSGTTYRMFALMAVD